MARVLWLLGTVAIAAIAVTVLFRGEALAALIDPAAGDAPACVSTDSFVPAFCVNVPTSAARRETTVPLVTLPSARADVRVEVSVPGSDAAALAAGVDRSIERVEALFGRTFTTRPRVLIFGGALSFATGAKDLFGYSRATADHVANTYGGIFDRPTLTIAVNWGASGTSRMNAAIAHELTHLMTSEIGGSAVPAWLDEGVATVVEQEANAAFDWSSEEELVGRAVAASGAVTLAQLQSVADFHAAYGRLDRPLYAFAADAVRAMRTRIGWDGVVRVLAAVGAGQDVAVAYESAAREPLAQLERHLAASAAPQIVATTTRDADGNVHWTLYAGRASSEVHVAITGTTDYRVSFTVQTDAFGMYRGSFGSTAAPGTYTVLAGGAVATLVTGR